MNELLQKLATLSEKHGPLVVIVAVLMWYCAANDSRNNAAREKTETYVRETLEMMIRSESAALAKNSELVNQNTQALDRTRSVLERVTTFLEK